jgi:hypothetical protein
MAKEIPARAHVRRDMAETGYAAHPAVAVA